MKRRTQTLEALLMLSLAVVAVCAFVSMPDFTDSAGIIIAGVIAYLAVKGQGERILSVMDAAIRRSTPIYTRIPVVRLSLLASCQSIGLPLVDTGLIAARATPTNAPPAFIR